MKVANTYEDRMALIKEIAERRNKLSKVKTKTRTMKAPRVKRDYMDVPTESNIYQYTDASKYAKEYYGETHFETTRYDNDWD